MLEFRLRQGMSEFIDFEKSILDVIILKDLNADILHSILSPILVNKGKHKQFNLMKAVDYQRIRNEEEDEQISIDLEEEMEQKEKEIKEQAERRNLKIERYIEKILEVIYSKKPILKTNPVSDANSTRNKTPEIAVETTLEEAIKRFDDETYNSAATDFDFYSLIMMLHQNKELNLNEILEVGANLVSDNTYNINLEFLLSRVINKNKQYKEIKVLALFPPDEKAQSFVESLAPLPLPLYEFPNGNVITNFIIKGVF